MEAAGTPVTDFTWPSAVPGNGGSFTINQINGAIEWYSPETAGVYVIALIINEFRNGQLISSVVRDMLIEVGVGFGGYMPPVVNVTQDNFQAIPGSTVEFDVEFEDPDFDELLITATGGPFLVAPPAEFNISTDPISSPATISFSWATTPDLAREQPYQVVFTAVDNSSDSMHWQKPVQILIKDAPLFNPEKKNFEQLNISPNPTSGISNLIIENPKLQFGKLSISKINGEIVFNKKLNGDNNLLLDFSEFSKGIYFIKIQTENLIGAGRIVKTSE